MIRLPARQSEMHVGIRIRTAGSRVKQACATLPINIYSYDIGKHSHIYREILRPKIRIMKEEVLGLSRRDVSEGTEQESKKKNQRMGISNKVI